MLEKSHMANRLGQVNIVMHLVFLLLNNFNFPLLPFEKMEM